METDIKKIAKNKLFVLYLLSKIKLLETQVISLCAEIMGMDYFDTASCLSALKASADIAELPGINGISFQICPGGKNTLEQYKKSLNYTLRQKADSFIKENRVRLELEGRIFTSYTRVSLDSYRVILRVTENDALSFELALLAHSKEECERIVQRFRAEPINIYRKIFDVLLIDSYL